MNAVQKLIAAQDEKFSGQLTQLHAQTERMREVASKRLEEKLSTFELAHPRLERRLAELTGNYKGLSEELQSQIRRVDQMDARHLDWRQTIEEETRQKYSALEQQAYKATSVAKASNSTLEEERRRHHQRLLKLETMTTDHQQSHDEARDGLMNLHMRLESLEALQNEPPALLAGRAVVGPPPEDTNAELVRILELRVNEGSDRMENFLSDVHDIHGRLEAQEERLRGLRTLLETREEHWRSLGERLERHDWDARFEQLRLAQQRDAKTHTDHQESLQIVLRRLEDQESAHEELKNRHQEFARRSGGGASDLEELDARLRELSLRFEILESEQSPTAELVSKLQDLSPSIVSNSNAIAELQVTHAHSNGTDDRISSLVETLQGLSPHVLENSTLVQRLSERVQILEEGGRDASIALASNSASREDRGAAELQDVLPKVDVNFAALGQRVAGLEEELATVAERLEPILGAMKTVMQTAQGLVASSGQPQSLAAGSTGAAAVPTAAEKRVAELAGDLAAHSERVGKRHDEFERRVQAELGALRREAAQHSGFAAAVRTPAPTSPEVLADLAAAMRKDEEEELAIHQRLVARVDEMCDRLAIVCSSVAASASACGATGGTGSPAAPGPDLAQYESLVRRVERSESRSAELASQIQAQMREIGSLLRAGGIGSSM